MEKNHSNICWILDERKERAHLDLVQMERILECNTQFNFFQMQHDISINNNDSAESSEKQLNINLAYLEIDNMNDDIFGMNAYLETDYHIASDKIDIIFNGNEIHCTEVKHSTYDDFEQLKE